MSVEIASRDNDFNNRQHKTSAATEVFIYKRGLFNGNLNDGKPFLRIFLIPDAVDIAVARMSCNLVPLLFHIGVCFCDRFIETFIWTIMFPAEHFRNSRQSLELVLCCCLYPFLQPAHSILCRCQ